MAVQDLQSTSTSDYASPDYAFLNVAGGAILEPCGRHMRNRLDRILTDLLPRVPNCEDDIDIHVGGVGWFISGHSRLDSSPKSRFLALPALDSSPKSRPLGLPGLDGLNRTPFAMPWFICGYCDGVSSIISALSSAREDKLSRSEKLNRLLFVYVYIFYQSLYLSSYRGLVKKIPPSI